MQQHGKVNVKRIEVLCRNKLNFVISVLVC
jgi:hypothetical protein